MAFVHDNIGQDRHFICTKWFITKMEIKQASKTENKHLDLHTKVGVSSHHVWYAIGYNLPNSPTIHPSRPNLVANSRLGLYLTIVFYIYFTKVKQKIHNWQKCKIIKN